MIPIVLTGLLPCPRWMEIVWCGPGAYPGRPQTRILLTSSWVSILHQEVCSSHIIFTTSLAPFSCFGKISCFMKLVGNISCLLSILVGKSAVYYILPGISAVHHFFWRRNQLFLHKTRFYKQSFIKKNYLNSCFY